MHDLRFAVRTLVKAPVFSVLAVVLIALSIGLNAALLSVLYASVLKPLPFKEPTRLVHVVEAESGRPIAPLTPANFDDVRRDATSFAGVTGYRTSEVELSGIDSPQRVTALHVLDGFFEVVGVTPTIGRAFASGDFYTAPASDGLWSVGGVAILGHGFWQRRFGGSADVVGTAVRLNDKNVTIVGVVPKGFDALWRETDLYVPWILPPDFWSVRPPHALPMLARLAPGVAIETASSEVATIYSRLAAEYPETNEVLTGHAEPLRGAFKNTTRAVTVLFAGALMVLIVALSNLAGLMATRVRKRLREVAVRRALGASAARITRQLLVESSVLVLAGGSVGIALAHVALGSIAVPMSLPFAPELNAPVLGGVVVLLATTVLFLGFTPALLVSNTDLSSSLRGRSDNVSSRRLANAFVVVQFAVALGLVSAGGLLLKSLTVLENEELGFDAEGVQSLYVVLPDTRYRGEDAQRQFRRRALEELRAIPGVSSVDTASHVPTTPMKLDLATAIEGRPLPRGTLRAAPVFVSHGLLRTLGIPLQRGRDFDERDSKTSPWVIVVNERMAGVFWPNEEALDKRIRLEYPWAPDAPLTVIGVVSDVKQEGVGHNVRPSFYILHEQFPQEWFYFAIRTDGASDNVVSAVRARLAAMDASLPMTDVKTMSERVADSLAEHRARTQLVGLYAAAGLVLATLGLYGTLTSLVGQRTKELAIRMALGATTAEITRLVLGHGARQLLAGIALGLALAVVGGRFVESLLYEAEPMDGVSLLITTTLLTGSGLLAALLPARRAGRLELATRLRQD